MPYSSITWNISCFQSAWNIIQYIFRNLIFNISKLVLYTNQGMIDIYLYWAFFLVIFTLCYSFYCNCFSNLMIKKAIYSFVLHLKFSKSIAIAVVKVPIKLTILLRSWQHVLGVKNFGGSKTWGGGLKLWRVKQIWGSNNFGSTNFGVNIFLGLSIFRGQ